MKKTFFLLTSIAILSVACNRNAGETKSNSKSDDIAEYALPLDTAISYTRNYNDLAVAVLGDSAPIRSYTIRAEDLVEAMGIPHECAEQAKYKDIRVYLGIDGQNKFRLLLTPVEGADIEHGVAGDDVILDGQFVSGNNPSGDMQTGRYVMDFTGPCPNSCSSSSPLYNTYTTKSAK
jgi:hypothetical protein